MSKPTESKKVLMRKVLAALGPDAHEDDGMVHQVVRYKSGIKKGHVHGHIFSRLEYAAAQLDLKGGKARAENLTKKRISKIQQMGGRARWARPRTSRPARGFMILMVVKPRYAKYLGEKWYVRTSRRNPTLAVTPFKNSDGQMVHTQLEATAFRTEQIANSVIKRIVTDTPYSREYMDYSVIEVA